MSNDPGGPKSRWKRASTFIAIAAVTGIIGATAYAWFDAIVGGIADIVSPPSYSVSIPVMPLAEGGSGYGYATPLFTRLRRELEGTRQLRLDPPELERLRICRPFEATTRDAEQMLRSFADAFSDCLRLRDSGPRQIHLEANRTPALTEPHPGAFFCGCSQAVVEQVEQGR